MQAQKVQDDMTWILFTVSLSSIRVLISSVQRAMTVGLVVERPRSNVERM